MFKWTKELRILLMCDLTEQRICINLTAELNATRAPTCRTLLVCRLTVTHPWKMLGCTNLSFDVSSLICLLTTDKHGNSALAFFQRVFDSSLKALLLAIAKYRCDLPSTTKFLPDSKSTRKYSDENLACISSPFENGVNGYSVHGKSIGFT